MGTLAQQRAGLKTRLATITTLNSYAYLPKNPQYPCGYVGQPIEMDPNVTQGGVARTTQLPVWIGVPWNDDESSDDALEGYVESVPTAILAAPQLGGACDDLTVEAADGFNQEAMNDGRTVQWFRIVVTVYS